MFLPLYPLLSTVIGDPGLVSSAGDIFVRRRNACDRLFWGGKGVIDGRDVTAYKGKITFPRLGELKSLSRDNTRQNPITVNFCRFG